MKPLSVAICGFGQIGRLLLRHLAGRPEFEVVEVVDTDPGLIGRSAAVLAESGKDAGLAVAGEIGRAPAGGIALLTSCSAAAEAEPAVRALLEAGWRVVTTCEELSYPWRRHAGVARRLDDEARERGSAVLGTGINPGFLMDLLPALLSGASSEIRRIAVTRIQDASPRRRQFQKKIGAGLDEAEFRRREAAGSLRHVGLTESIDFLAAAVGWELAEVRESLEMVRAETDLALPGAIPVRAGQARGVHQEGVGLLADGTEVIRLSFRAAIGEADPGDTVRIEGDPVIESRIAGGVNGDRGTCAVMTSALRRLAASELTGFLTMLELPPAGGLPARRT